MLLKNLLKRSEPSPSNEEISSFLRGFAKLFALVSPLFALVILFQWYELFFWVPALAMLCGPFAVIIGFGTVIETGNLRWIGIGLINLASTALAYRELFSGSWC